MGGCHLTRDTFATIREAGFRPESHREFLFPPSARLSVVGPRVLGVARA